jgi:hypothetical protein
MLQGEPGKTQTCSFEDSCSAELWFGGGDVSADDDWESRLADVAGIGRVVTRDSPLYLAPHPPTVALSGPPCSPPSFKNPS